MPKNVLIYKTGSKKYEKPMRISVPCLQFSREAECINQCGKAVVKPVGPKTAHVATIPFIEYVLDCATCKPRCVGAAKHGTLKLDLDNNCNCN